MDKDMKAIIERMSLEEKAALCTGANVWQTVAVEHVDIPTMTVSDGPHGVRRIADPTAQKSETLAATCFPTASALAASWDVELLRKVGEALGDECIALDVDILLGPGNNMKRSPLCGRNFEYYSEDPFLGGELAASFITGVQSKGVGTSLKHYVANNQETDRFVVDAVVDERALREVYLAGFERAVKQGKPWTVMCAYNRLNGIYCSQHPRTLTHILRDEWGFEGFVVSDWGAVHDRVAALAAGLELEMPGPRPVNVQLVVEAVQNDLLDEAILDTAVERLLNIIFKAKETEKGSVELDIEGHHALARQVAGEGIVLLKNEGDLLPLKGGEKLAVIGQSAKIPYFQGGGSSHINPTKVDNPFEELQELAGDAELVYAQGYTEEQEVDQALIDEAIEAAEQAEIALLYIALPSAKESEGYDRPDMTLSEQQVALIKAVAAAQPKSVVIMNNGSAVQMIEWIDDVPAVLEAWMMGQAGGGAIADVLFGEVNPSGKLAETFPLKLSDTPSHLNFPGENRQVRYGEGIFIGYRYYDFKEMDVLFPFGYGLSYTTFDYSNLEVSSSVFQDVDGLTVSFDVTNTGDVAGKEIAQVYVHDHEATLVRPYKELKGFVKVALEPGETKTVTVELDSRAFAYYNPAYELWVTEDGAFDILVGRSAADICLSETVRMESSQALPSLLDRESTLREWLEDPRGAVVLNTLIQQLRSQLSEGVGGFDLEALNFLREMPLSTVLGFLSGHMEMLAELSVDDLLEQVQEEQT